MRIISKSRLRNFWESRATIVETERAQRDLNAWYKVARKAEWSNFGSLRRTFGSADQVGNCVVFDVGNNRFRLIGRVFYETERQHGIVYVLKVMEHSEYDRGLWPAACRCHEPRPPSRRGRRGEG